MTEVQAQPQIKVRPRPIIVEYQREPGFPFMVAGVYSNQTTADKAIKRLTPLMGGKPSFRTR